MGRVIKIYEALLNRKEKICRKSDIIEIVDEYNKTLGKVNAKNTLKYLSRHGYIRRIFLHFYYINSMDERERGFCAYEDRELLFAVLNRLDIRWYLGMSSALYVSGKAWQIPNILTIINNRISGKRKILGMNVRFFKIKETLIFGLKRGRTKNNIGFFYSDQAKTHIDLVYFRESSKITAMEHTLEYLRRYPKWLKKSI